MRLAADDSHGSGCEHPGPPTGINLGPSALTTEASLSLPGRGCLYAAGNVASRVLGPAIYGAGVTIASAVTFAYLAARHAADRAR